MMITDPIDLADRLYELLQARMPNGSFVVKKQHRDAVIEAELLLRELFRR